MEPGRESINRLTGLRSLDFITEVTLQCSRERTVFSVSDPGPIGYPNAQGEF